MATRGRIIRQEIPAELRELVPALASAAGMPEDQVGIEGRDGTGRKTEIPWVRVFSRPRAPRATDGWYVVYLFSALGDRVYLTLMVGATVWTGAEFRPRPVSEVQKQVAWGRATIDAAGSGLDLVESITLDARRSDLGAAYEMSTLYAVAYSVDDIPDDAQLQRDLIGMFTLLGQVYTAEDRAAYVPGSQPPEVINAQASADRAAGVLAARRGGGQGFGLTKDQQDAVELQAIKLACVYLEEQGWKSKYVGASETWDIVATKDDQTIWVEVKGTTSPGQSVILTGPQVVKYRLKEPSTRLVVVHGIQLDRSASDPVASGGAVADFFPWIITDEALTPVSWKLRTGLMA